MIRFFNVSTSSSHIQVPSYFPVARGNNLSIELLIYRHGPITQSIRENITVYYTADHYPNTRLAKTNEQTNKHGVPEGKQA